jgi:ketosteroid isomerase-like protein
MDGVERVREYYRAIDEDEYGTLTRLLAGGFVHRRPDMTIEGREEFVSFMRVDRPERETTHDIESVYLEADTENVAVEGRLLDADDEEWFRFVDTFEQVESGIESVRTYTDLGPD